MHRDAQHRIEACALWVIPGGATCGPDSGAFAPRCVAYNRPYGVISAEVVVRLNSL
ncbi:MAG: hypothetical protein ISP68_01690 [Flavobacteriaceae bacterium]|nr:hypothetical protein [Flavobacteriaceae bacterium]